LQEHISSHSIFEVFSKAEVGNRVLRRGSAALRYTRTLYFPSGWVPKDHYCHSFSWYDRALPCTKGTYQTALTDDFIELTELIQGGLLSPSLPISHCTMDIIPEDQAADSFRAADHGPTFLYRLVPGYRQQGQSLALWCAKNALVPERTLSRGNQGKLSEIRPLLRTNSWLAPKLVIFYECFSSKGSCQQK
jgi:hypothetical protein